MMVKENDRFDQRELKRVAGAQRTACGVWQPMASNSNWRAANSVRDMRCSIEARRQNEEDSGNRI